MTTSIAWLHISDFHFRAEGDLFSQRQICNALLESVAEIASDRENNLAFATVTGDVAFAGTPEEYAEAEDFFRDLSRVANLDPASFYFVPGNHDVVRGLETLAYRGGVTEINSPERVDYYLSDSTLCAPLLRRQAAFWQFVRRFTDGQTRHTADDQLGYVARIDIDRPSICIVGLNSAWLSGTDDDKLKLVIGERQVINTLQLARQCSPHLIIAMAHHPIDELTQWDAASCRARLLPVADFYIRGHLHQHQVALSSGPAHPCIEIAAGSSHATRFFRNSYNVIRLDLEAARCTIESYDYDSSVARFAASDRSEADVKFSGSIPGSRSRLASVIGAQVPEAADFGNFMAGLLHDQLAEVPICIGNQVQFCTPALASELAPEDEWEHTRRFLALKNSLRLFDPAISVDDRIASHQDVVREYASVLQSAIQADSSCTQRLNPGGDSQQERWFNDSQQPWSLQLLEELRQSEDWMAVEACSRDLASSKNSAVAREALRILAEALMRSDEFAKQREAYDIGCELAANHDANEMDTIIASAAAEAAGEDSAAVRIARRGIQANPAWTDLIEFTRQLARRIGDREFLDYLAQLNSAVDT